MTPKEWAELLHKREYLSEITDEEAEQAKRDGVVILFGSSDDLLEMRGAVDDEVGAWNGTTVFFTKNGLVESRCNNERCPYHEEEKKTAAKVAVDGPPWVFATSIPHECFHILEDGEVYGNGIVFRLADVPEVKP